MKTGSSILPSVIVFLLAAVMGATVQLVLWNHGGRSLGEALLHWPILWVLYFAVAVLGVEHFYRHLNAKALRKENEARRNLQQ